MAGITVSQLPDNSHGAFLYCAECGGHWSATKGDYFWMPPDELIVCCGEPMILATERREILPLLAS